MFASLVSISGGISSWNLETPTWQAGNNKTRSRGCFQFRNQLFIPSDGLKQPSTTTQITKQTILPRQKNGHFCCAFPSQPPRRCTLAQFQGSLCRAVRDVPGFCQCFAMVTPLSST